MLVHRAAVIRTPKNRPPALEGQTRVVGHSALNGEATGGTKREEHGSLAVGYIVGRLLMREQGATRQVLVV